MESIDNLKERFNGLTEGGFEPEELESLKKEVNLKTISGRYSVIQNLQGGRKLVCPVKST